MQCNQSSGARFPGDWSSMELTPAPQTPLPVHPREACRFAWTGRSADNDIDDSELQLQGLPPEQEDSQDNVDDF